jgi:hypothetical protein
LKTQARFLSAGITTVSDELLRRIESEVHPSDQMIEIYTHWVARRQIEAMMARKLGREG